MTTFANLMNELLVSVGYDILLIKKLAKDIRLQVKQY
jgi:hypothetical protein